MVRHGDEAMEDLFLPSLTVMIECVVLSVHPAIWTGLAAHLKLFGARTKFGEAGFQRTEHRCFRDTLIRGRQAEYYTVENEGSISSFWKCSLPISLGFPMPSSRGGTKSLISISSHLQTPWCLWLITGILNFV